MLGYKTSVHVVVVVIIGLNVLPLIPIFGQEQKSKFSCDRRTSGYYADVRSGCRVYHMCDGLGRQFSYTCPNATLFQQRMLICDHWYMVNCSRSEADYGANLRIGQKEMPFVDDSESNPYHRTPRPDLADHPSPISQTEYDIIYRTGREQLSGSSSNNNQFNVVGVESDTKNAQIVANNNKPTYTPPSHWSTEYSLLQTSTAKSASPVAIKQVVPAKKSYFENGSKRKQSVVTSPSSTERTKSNVNFASRFKATTPVFPIAVDSNNEASDSSKIGLSPPFSTNGEEDLPSITGAPTINNFPSSFTATTPVFPIKTNGITFDGDAENAVGLLPPLPYKNNVQDSSGSKKINFKSSFKATTPVYPKFVHLKSATGGLLPPKIDGKSDEGLVKFPSNFKATTPMYPDSVESTSVDPGNLGILPPKYDRLSVAFQPPKRDESIQHQHDDNVSTITPQTPSKFYQPPKFEPDYKEILLLSQLKSDTITNSGSQTATTLNNREPFTNENLDTLRRKFFIPDFDFPLDSVSRPSYDSVLSSFETKSDPLKE